MVEGMSSFGFGASDRSYRDACLKYVGVCTRKRHEEIWFHAQRIVGFTSCAGVLAQYLYCPLVPEDMASQHDHSSLANSCNFWHLVVVYPCPPQGWCSFPRRARCLAMTPVHRGDMAQYLDQLTSTVQTLEFRPGTYYISYLRV